jgi:hypothetical protein
MSRIVDKYAVRFACDCTACAGGGVVFDTYQLRGVAWRAAKADGWRRKKLPDGMVYIAPGHRFVAEENVAEVIVP